MIDDGDVNTVRILGGYGSVNHHKEFSLGLALIAGTAFFPGWHFETIKRYTATIRSTTKDPTAYFPSTRSPNIGTGLVRAAAAIPMIPDRFAPTGRFVLTGCGMSFKLLFVDKVRYSNEYS